LGEFYELLIGWGRLGFFEGDIMKKFRTPKSLKQKWKYNADEIRKMWTFHRIKKVKK